MKSSIIATAAFAAYAAASSAGSAIVVNKCSYDVFLCNVPSSNGGYSNVDKTLSTGDTYEQAWTQLSTGNGWSIKLSKTEGAFLSNIMQYEYTFNNDGTIWYDLSEVDGNPWNGNWEIDSDSSDCKPKQQAYRFAKDDAYGEQSCPTGATITVTLCSGDEDDSSSSASSSAAATTSTPAAASSSSAAPASSSSSAAYSSAISLVQDKQVAAPTTTSAARVSTTLQTSVITSAASVADADVIVTVTQVATHTEWVHEKAGGPGKREVHHHGHEVRHPHAGPA